MVTKKDILGIIVCATVIATIFFASLAGADVVLNFTFLALSAIGVFGSAVLTYIAEKE